jgi:hypothetical protein
VTALIYGGPTEAPLLVIRNVGRVEWGDHGEFVIYLVGEPYVAAHRIHAVKVELIVR